jgi:GH15 family glucan-1,4-alpha-glucosidase
MSLKIEDYALIGNMRTGALVGNNGSIDWLCVPRFDSGACFAALLGSPENGRWLIAPGNAIQSTRRRYRGPTLILETEFVTDSGAVMVVDFMPIAERHQQVDVARIVRGLRGTVPMRMEAAFRFDYGHIAPWITLQGGGLRAIAGPDALELRTPVPMHDKGSGTVAEFAIAEGESVPFTLTWYPSHEPEPAARNPMQMQTDTEAWWRQWSMARSGAAFADNAQGTHLWADWRYRRRSDHCAAGMDRRCAQLGLPLLLAARRNLHSVCLAARRLHGGSARLARLAFSRDRRRPRPHADSIWHRR